MTQTMIAETACPTCHKPVKLVSRFGKRQWEHALRRDTPVPWHNPTPETAKDS